MRRPTLLVAVVLAVSACGGVGARDDVTTSTAGATPASSSAAPTTPSTTTTIQLRSTTTTTAISTTTPSPPATTAGFELPAVLRSDGIATVDFGTDAEDAIVVLTELLGPPSETRDEGASDFYWSVEHVRFVTWDDFGLRLVFTDWGGDHAQPVASPLHLTDWEVLGQGLTTTEGLGWGTTVGELRAMYPDVQIGINELAPMFLVESLTGRIIGGFEWAYQDFARAVIAALNEHGAGLAPDDLGAATGRALLDFMEARGLHDAHDVLTALGLPPDDVRTGWMHAGTGPLCC